jgi:hypothetical protein
MYAPPNLKKRSSWTTFAIRLGVRCVGGLLIWLGDGDDSWFRKGAVIVGVVLSIGGIAILRYMVLSEPLSKLFSSKAA